MVCQWLFNAQPALPVKSLELCYIEILINVFFSFSIAIPLNSWNSSFSTCYRYIKVAICVSTIFMLFLYTSQALSFKIRVFVTFKCLPSQFDKPFVFASHCGNLVYSEGHCTKNFGIITGMHFLAVLCHIPSKNYLLKIC